VVVLLVNGLPVLLLVTTRGMRSGDQVCYSYGAAYWHAWAGLRAQIAKEQQEGPAGGSGQPQGLLL
jgi:hypothetical protein